MQKANEIDFFDQARIENFDRIVERAWEIISSSEKITSEKDTRNLIKLCVLDRMRMGEENHPRIVNEVTSDFRRRSILNLVHVKQADIQAR